MKKLTALLLIFAALLGVLAACRAEEDNETRRKKAADPLVNSSQFLDLSLEAYIYARLKTEEFLNADPAKVSPEELRKNLSEILSAYDAAQKAANAAETALDSYEASQKGKNTAKLLSIKDPFALECYAKSDAEEWAEKINKAYENTDRNAKSAERFRQLAEQLGTDARTAVKQFQTANEILAGNAINEAEFLDTCVKTATVIKTGSKVGLFVCGVIASGGTVGAAGITLAADSTALATAATVFSGADAMLDVAATGSTIVLGEDHAVSRTFSDAENMVGGVSSVLTLSNLVTSFDPKKAQDVFDGLSFVADTTVGLVAENKIMGIELSPGNKKPVKGVSYDVDIAGKTQAEAADAVRKAGGKLPEGGTRTVSDILKGWKATASDYLSATEKMIADAQKSAETTKADGTSTPVTGKTPDPKSHEFLMEVTYASFPVGSFNDKTADDFIYRNMTVTLFVSEDGSFSLTVPKGGSVVERDNPKRTYTYSADSFTIRGKLEDVGVFTAAHEYASTKLLSVTVEPGDVSFSEIIDYDPSVTYISTDRQVFSYKTSPNSHDDGGQPNASLSRSGDVWEFSYYDYVLSEMNGKAGTSSFCIVLESVK